MKKLIFALLFICLTINLNAQSKPIIYFCEKVENNKEYGVSDKFTTGYLTIVLQSKTKFWISEVTIQIDKMGPDKNFHFFKKIIKPVRREEYYMYINNVNFSEPGIFRVFALNNDIYLSSSLIEIF